MERRNSLKSNFSFNFINRIVLILIPLITTPYVTRVLGADELGQFSYANTIASYFVMLGTMGLAMHGSRAIAYTSNNIDRLKIEYSTLRGIQVINAVLFCMGYIIFVCAFKLVSLQMGTLQFLYVLSAVFDVTWFFSGIEEFKLISIRNIIINILATILIFVFVKNQDCLLIYSLIKVGTVLLGQVSLLITSARFFDFKLIDKERMMTHYKQMIILFLPVAIESIFQSMDRVMLGTLCSYTAVGLYYSSRMVTDIPQCLVTSINTIMYPRIVNLKACGKDKETQILFNNSFLIVNALCIALCFGISAVAIPFVSVFFGHDYYLCSSYIPLLTPYIALAAWNGTIRYQYLLPNNLDKIYIRAVLVGIIVNLGINFILIPKYGVSGAIIATILAELFTAIIQTIPVRRKVNASKQLISVIPFVIIGIIMYLFIFLIDNILNSSSIIKLFIEMFVGALIYISFSLGYVALGRKDLFKQLKQYINK